MARAFDPSERVRYVLLADRELPTEQRTTWVFRKLTVFDSIELESKHGAKVDEASAATYAIDVVRMALCGWENLTDASGAQVAFESSADGRATDLSISRAQAYLLELFRVSMSSNAPQAEEVGKS